MNWKGWGRKRLSSDSRCGSVICLRGTEEYQKNFSDFGLCCLDQDVSCEISEFGTDLSPAHSQRFGHEEILHSLVIKSY